MKNSDEPVKQPEPLRQEPIMPNAEDDASLHEPHSAQAVEQLRRQKSSWMRALMMKFVLFLLFVSLVMGGGYYLFKVYASFLSRDVSMTVTGDGTSSVGESRKALRTYGGSEIILNMYYPVGNTIEMEERKVMSTGALRDLARVTVEEFLSGPAGRPETVIPEDSHLIGIYNGSAGILYVDFTQGFKRNFHGNLMDEYLLLRALHESIASNVHPITGIKLLIEGEEVDSLGGHVMIRGPLGEALALKAPAR